MTQEDQKMPRIAVVIPCYNHTNVLRRTLESLSRQTLQPTEVVVIDDASVDHPQIVVQEFEARMPIRFIRFDANRGAPAARNEGARQTVSPFILFLDADAELVPHALAQFASALEDHPDAAFAYSNLHWGARPFRAKPFDVSELKRRNFIHTSSLIRRDAFPGFDESIKKLQDWDLWLAMAEQGLKGVWIDEFLYRIEPRREGGISKWLPSTIHRIPWPIFGWMPQEIRKYRAAERIIREKHRI